VREREKGRKRCGFYILENVSGAQCYSQSRLYTITPCSVWILYSNWLEGVP